jgi:uncharacterized protein YdhG (YjbR/CyaY superfamily)
MATDEFGGRARREIRRQMRKIRKRNAQREADDAAADAADTTEQVNPNLSQQVQWGNSNQFDNDGNPILRHKMTSNKGEMFDH